MQNAVTDLLTSRHDHLDPDAHAVIESEAVRISGRPTLYDPDRDTVLHVKPRNGWYKFHPPVERHLDQLHAYMAGLDADHGQLVYVSLADPADVRTWPPRDHDADTVPFDADRLDNLLDKAHRIREHVISNGIATRVRDIPFDPCGCYFCENEVLKLPTLRETEKSEDEGAAGTTETPQVTESAKSAVRPLKTDGGTKPVTVTGPCVPADLRDRDIWVVWDGKRKVALAPWQTGHMYPCKWAAAADTDPRASYEKVQMVAELNVTQIHQSWPFPDEAELPQTVLPAVLLPHECECPLCVVDIDGVRDAETGETTEEAAGIIDRLAGYTEVSQSGTGFHVYIEGRIPGDREMLSVPLREAGHIEVYDSSRFVASTWQHVEGTPRNTVPSNSTALQSIIDEYEVG